MSIRITGDKLNLDVIKSYKGNMNLHCLIPILFANLMHKKKSPVVEQVFLIYKDGRLISYASRKGEECLDEDIVGGMLTAVMNLILFAFDRIEEGKEDIDLYKFEFGGRRLILETGKHFFIAIVLLGRENKSLLSKSEAIVRDIEEKYGSVLGEWEGFGDDFKGVDEIILTLLPLDKLSETERKEIGDEGKKMKVIELWSKIWHSLIQDGLMPKPHTWKNLKWKPIIDDEKEPDGEDQESESSETKPKENER